MNITDTPSPKISIIIPAYNVEPYIGQLLDCILRQTMQDYEVIIVNDGSADNTRIIVSEYCEKFSHFTCIEQTNMGQSAARNTAMAVAKGEFFAFLDADDLITEDYLEKLYNACHSENADVSRCTIMDFSESIDQAWEACNPRKKAVEFEEGHTYSFFNSPCAGLIRVDFLREYDISFSVGEQMEDSPFGIIINVLANKTVYVEDGMYFHRVFHKGSTMTKLSEGKQNPNVPYNGMSFAAELLKKVITDPIQAAAAEYLIANTMACLNTSAYINYHNSIRKQVSNFTYEYMDRFYPKIMKNPYLFGSRMGRIKSLPISQRIAVQLFALSYKTRCLYPFSVVIAFFLRILG